MGMKRAIHCHSSVVTEVGGCREDPSGNYPQAARPQNLETVGVGYDVLLQQRMVSDDWDGEERSNWRRNHEGIFRQREIIHTERGLWRHFGRRARLERRQTLRRRWGCGPDRGP